MSVQHSIVTKVWYPPLPTTRSDSQASGLCPGMYNTHESTVTTGSILKKKIKEIEEKKITRRVP